MSVVKVLRPEEERYFKLEYRGSGIPGDSVPDAEGFCNAHGLGRGLKEHNHLAQCPPKVRAAIAMHYLWDQLIRSNYKCIQLLAYAYLNAAHVHSPAVAATSGHELGQRMSLRVGRIQPNYYGQSAFANRLLRSLAYYREGQPIRAANADLIKLENCRSRERSGMGGIISGHAQESDDTLGLWAVVPQSSWDENAGRRFVRAPKALVRQFFQTVRPLFQPYLHDAFDIAKNDAITELHVRIRKVRSVMDRKVVTLGLCHLMEEIVEVLPHAVNYALNGGYPRYWMLDSVQEADRYTEGREERGLQSLAMRGDLNAALNWHDAHAEAAYLTPQVKPRIIGGHVENLALEVPGLDRTRVKPVGADADNTAAKVTV